jgi:hypothetical protein
MKMRIASLALLAGFAGAPAVALADERPVAAEVSSIKTPAPAAQQDVSGYAQREAQDKKASDFQGGQTVIVISGAALIALILFLILI